MGRCPANTLSPVHGCRTVFSDRVPSTINKHLFDKEMDTPSVEAFQSAAEEFCALAADERPLTKEDLWKIRELLIRLIFHIPAVDSHQHGVDFDVERIGAKEFGRATKRFGELPFNFYRVVFDPHDFEAKDEPVTGMLADDLGDIYRDLAQGLENSRNGHIDEACCDWSQSYMFHWARHAVNALSAIEIYRIDNNERAEQSAPDNRDKSGA